MAGTLCSAQVVTHMANPPGHWTMLWGCILLFFPASHVFPFPNLSGALEQELALNYPGKLPRGSGRERPEECAMTPLEWENVPPLPLGGREQAEPPAGSSALGDVITGGSVEG